MKLSHQETKLPGILISQKFKEVTKINSRWGHSDCSQEDLGGNVANIKERQALCDS